MKARGGRYILDVLIIEHMAGDEMCLLEFCKGDWPTTTATADNEQESDDSGMNE